MNQTFSSGSYWEDRYAAGETSGSGSYGRLAEFKAQFLNRFVKMKRIGSVIEFGCGDGNQLSLADYKSYIGVDVSPTAVELCKRRFVGDPTKAFLTDKAYSGQTADLALSLDVIFHLVEDAVFDTYMRRLFAAGRKFVIVYASNHETETRRQHVRHRFFSDWVLHNRPDFILVKYKSNPYSSRSRKVEAGETSPSDFYVFKNIEVRETSVRAIASRSARAVVASPLGRAARSALATITAAGPKIDLVTVVFDDELPLLAVQARSIRTFLPPGMLGSYVIVVNERDPLVCRRFITTRIAHELGSLADRVVVSDLSAFSSSPGEVEGWLAQQACKLAASRLCRSEHCLILDAKHHLIRRIGPADLFESGRARKPLRSTIPEQRQWLLDSLMYFNVDPKLAEIPAPASAPPFVMHVPTVRAMITEIEERERSDLLTFFARKMDFSTEFLLYYAYILSKGDRDKRLVDGEGGHRDLRIVTRGKRREELEVSLFDPRVWCFSIHRRRLAKLPTPDRQLVTKVWHSSGLFPSRDRTKTAVHELSHHFRNLRTIEAERIQIRDARRARLAALSLPARTTNSQGGTTFDRITAEFSGVKYMNESRAKILRDIIVHNDAETILEIGFFRGKSSLYIAAILEDLGRGQLTTIDKLTAKTLTPNIETLSKRAGLSHRINHIFSHRSFTWELCKLIRQKPKPQFDLCYFDGGHTWDDTGFGFTLVDLLLKPGGIIVFDDLDWTIDGSSAFKRNPDLAKLYSEDERATPTVRLVWETLVLERGYAQIKEIASVGWAVARKPA